MLDLNTIWLKISYYRLTHVEDLRKWWVIIFIAIDVFIFVFCVTNVVLYVVDVPREERLMTALAVDAVDYQKIREQNKPLALQVVATSIVPVGGAKYDLAAKVKNENKNWAGIVVTYSFTLNGQSTPSQKDSILPNSEKFFTVLGIEGPAQVTAATNATFTLERVEWQRIPETSGFSRTQFIIEDIDFSISADLGNSRIQQVRAMVKNTGYTSFWQTRFIVILYQGDKIVGISYARLEQFRAGEERALAVSVNIIATPTQAQILPDINLLDGDNLMP